MNGISKQNPFVGPRPIQQGELLFGRSVEVLALYNQLLARRIVVLHSPSGAGKSSLVYAGLTKKLQESEFDVWKAIRVNLDPDSLEDIPPNTNRYLLSAMVSLEEELPARHRRSPAELARLDFHSYLSSRPRRKGRTNQSVVLLFDQFEEVLTVAPQDTDAKRQLFIEIGKALDKAVGEERDTFWALFIIREDYLAALTPYRDYIPTQLSNTFRLDFLSREAAREAAVQLAYQGGRSFFAVDQLIRDLSTIQVQQSDGSFKSEQGRYVEPVHLQVVCHQLWNAMPEDDPTIDEEDIAKYADVSKALASYYAQAVGKIAQGNVAVARAVREWVGNKLIVGGIRSQVRQGSGESGGLDNALIVQLLSSYLVRAEQRAGANWYELSHDRLVEPVRQDNRAWELAHLHPLQVQAKLWENSGKVPSLLLSAEALRMAADWARQNAKLVTASEQEFLKKSQEMRDADQAQHVERARQVRLLWLGVSILGVLLVCTTAALLFAAKAKKEADAQSMRVMQASRQTEEQRKIAETQSLEAQAQQREAQAQQKEAEKQRNLAKELAKQARENAQAARQAILHMQIKLHLSNRDYTFVSEQLEKLPEIEFEEIHFEEAKAIPLNAKTADGQDLYRFVARPDAKVRASMLANTRLVAYIPIDFASDYNMRISKPPYFDFTYGGWGCFQQVWLLAVSNDVKVLPRLAKFSLCEKLGKEWN